MCGSGPKWKREYVQDHKFTYIDVNEFYEANFFTKFKYSLVYLIVIKTLLVYLADGFTAYLLLTNGWDGLITGPLNPLIPLKYSKWIFAGSIAMSFLLLLLEWYKAQRIIRSKDIAYAFTNITAYRYYSLKSYSYYCVFSRINDHPSKKESLAFWIFFRLKGWKHILFAEAPRQLVNGVTLWALAKQRKTVQKAVSMMLRYDKSDLIRTISFATMSFTVLMFILSLLVLLVAFILYLPMLCSIRGNLKKYVCHIIDKRIANMLKRKSVRIMKQEKKMLEKAKRNLSEKELLEIEEKKQMQKMQPTLPRVLNDYELAKKESMESMNSTITAQSSRPLLPHNLPAAIRSVEAPMPAASFVDGISNPLAVQQSHGFGARRPYRAASKRVAPQSVVQENVPQIHYAQPQGQQFLHYDNQHMPQYEYHYETRESIESRDRMEPVKFPEPRHSFIPAFQQQDESPPLSPVLPYSQVAAYEGPRPSLDERPRSIVIEDIRRPMPSALRDYDDSTDDEGPVKRKVTALAPIKPNYGRI